MIAYDLQCTNGHTFEGWFEDRKAYLDQHKKGLVTCPVCNETSVSIIPSTFAIKTSQIPNPATAPHLDAQMEQVGKQMMIAVPDPLIIQRHQEEICPFQVFQSGG